jgi:hypothetical protein
LQFLHVCSNFLCCKIDVAISAVFCNFAANYFTGAASLQQASFLQDSKIAAKVANICDFCKFAGSYFAAKFCCKYLGFQQFSASYFPPRWYGNIASKFANICD